MTAAQLAVATSASTAVDPENPWPGLESYDEGSADFFNGRRDEASELFRRILDEPVTVLFGKSGLGKTSLLHAGVFPRLRERDLLPITVRLQFRSGDVPLIHQVRAALLDALASEGIDHPCPEDHETLWEYLHRRDLEFWTRQNRLVRPVLFFDQFEELFTLGAANPDAVRMFREDLADLAENRIPVDVAKRIDQDDVRPQLDVQAMRYKIVLALREDFLADLEGWRQTMPTLRRNRMRLLPMGPEQALQAVYNECTKHLVPEAIARRIVAFLSSAAGVVADTADLSTGGAVEPALLSLFCRGVNDHRKRDRKPRFDDDLIEGAKGTIVADFYRSCINDQAPRVRCFIEEDLVTDHGYRNSYSVEDALGRHAVTAIELETLINRHLLRHEHHLGVERVELTHDLLTKAVVEERNERRRHEREALARKNGFKKFMRVAAVFGAIGVAAILVLAVLAYKAGREAESAAAVARSRELAALSGSMIERDPELAMVLAVDGLNDEGTAEARGALLDAARYVWPSAALDQNALGGTPDIVAMSADGNQLATLAGETLKLWDVTSLTPKELWRLAIRDATTLAFSPKEPRLAVGRANAITIVDTHAGRVSFELTPPLSEVNRRLLGFSPDSRWLAWKQSDSQMAIVDLNDVHGRTESMESDNVLGFAVLDGDTIMAVGEGQGLSMSSELLQRHDTEWTRHTIELPSCAGRESVSPGVRSLTTTWRGIKCTYQPDGSALADHTKVDRETADIVWSADGRTSVEVLHSGELIVGRQGHPEVFVKGHHNIAGEGDRTRLISVSEYGNRLAFIDNDARHHTVRIASLHGHKPFMSGFATDTFAVSPGGAWFAILTTDLATDATVADIFPIASNFDSDQLPIPRRIALDNGGNRTLSASPDSLMVNDGDSTKVYDVTTGQLRYPALHRAQPLGDSRELLLLREPTRVVNTVNGAEVRPAGVDRMEDYLAQSSPSGDAVALFRIQDGKAVGATYRVKGTGLMKVSEIREAPSAIDGEFVRSLDDGRTSRTAAPQLIGASRTGQFEIRKEPKETESEHDSEAMHLVRRNESGDVTVVTHLALTTNYRFSADDTLLAVWGDRGLQILETTTGKVVMHFKTDEVRAVEFVGNSIMRVSLREEVMLVPLDQTLMKNFAAWLNPQVSPEQRCLYGLTGATCR